MSNFNNIMIDRGNITGVVERSIDIDSAVLTLTHREEEIEGSMKINVTSNFFLTDKGDMLTSTTIRNNCIAIASDYGFNKFILE